MKVLRKVAPGLVVIWADRISKSPVGHCTARITLDRTLETILWFFMIECISPDKKTIGLYLALGRLRSDSAVGRIH
jgi:hypothetical protein